MSANEKTINTFATRVRQMILKFDEVKQENAELYAMVDERDAKIKALEEKLAQAQSDYDSLKMAKMMTISDNDMEATQKRIAKLIRDVNKCITLLGENKKSERWQNKNKINYSYDYTSMIQIFR